MKTKELLAGGLVRDLWFSDEDAFQRYMDQIHTEYKILAIDAAAKMCYTFS